MEKNYATWSLTLDTECPACKEDVDLTDADDFWGGYDFEVLEHGTDASRDVQVECPKCHHEFTVDFEY